MLKDRNKSDLLSMERKSNLLFCHHHCKWGVGDEGKNNVSWEPYLSLADYSNCRWSSENV